MAVPAKHFHALGGFDEGYPTATGEDCDFCARCRNNGYGLVYASEVINYHWRRLNAAKFWRQHFAYGRVAYRFHRMPSHRSGETYGFEPLRFYSGLIRYHFLKGRNPRLLCEATLIVWGRTANTFGFLFESGKLTRLRRMIIQS